METNILDKWEIEHSSLYKQTLIQKMIIRNLILTKKDCKEFACTDIVSKLTPINTSEFLTEIPAGSKFCFLARVDTSKSSYDRVMYYKQFEERNYIAFSTITEENISHYQNANTDFMLAYDIPAEAIVHIFPCDSDTYTKADNECALTRFPSLWLSLEELNKITKKLGVYNQITCKTKHENKILKPKAVIAFDTASEKAIKVAKHFNINCIVVHPKEKAISYTRDVMVDRRKFAEVSKKMEEMFNISLYPQHLF